MDSRDEEGLKRTVAIWMDSRDEEGLRDTQWTERRLKKLLNFEPLVTASAAQKDS